MKYEGVPRGDRYTIVCHQGAWQSHHSLRLAHLSTEPWKKPVNTGLVLRENHGTSIGNHEFTSQTCCFLEQSGTFHSK